MADKDFWQLRLIELFLCIMAKAVNCFILFQDMETRSTLLLGPVARKNTLADLKISKSKSGI